MERDDLSFTNITVALEQISYRKRCHTKADS